MKRVLLFTLVAIALVTISYAREMQGEYPSVSVYGRIYSTWSMVMSDSLFPFGEDNFADYKGYSHFSLDRSYVTVKAKLSDQTSVNITTDLRETDAFGGYTMILRFGYAEWRPKIASQALSLRLGLQPTKYPEYLDSQIWGRRYVERNAGDLNGILTTADLGATLNYDIGEEGKFGAAGLSLWNGTSFTDIEERNKQKDFNFYGAFKPLVNNEQFKNTMLLAQFYMGTRNVALDTAWDAADYKRQIISVAGKFDYQDFFFVGGDFWMNTEGMGPNAEVKEQVISAFGDLKFKKFVGDNSPLRTLNLFFRYDMHDPNTDVDDDGDNWMIVGLECAPIKGVAASVNYRSRSFQAEGAESRNFLYLNTEFRF